MVELFFDLVFVFAVTQLSHRLLAHLTPHGALETLLLFLAVWWLWIYTSWITNWLDPDRIPVRLMLFAQMLGGLVLAAAIPEAFAERGLAFGAVFATLQVGRSLFMLYALRGQRFSSRRNFQRITLWLTASAAFWVLGGLAAPGERLAWWLLALAIEYCGPLVSFHVPGLGRSVTADWDIDGGHLAERCALFVIIALGESILVTGATFSELPGSAADFLGFGVALVGSIAMWWVYFDTGAERAAHRISQLTDPGRMARLAYTYLHLLIVAGIIVSAVADELVLLHPGHAEPMGGAVLLGGPALYLAGTALFKWASNDRRLPPLSHLAGLGLLLALLPWALTGHASALVLGALTTGIVVLTAGWESLALRRFRPR